MYIFEIECFVQSTWNLNLSEKRPTIGRFVKGTKVIQDPTIATIDWPTKVTHEQAPTQIYFGGGRQVLIPFCTMLFRAYRTNRNYISSLTTTKKSKHQKPGDEEGRRYILIFLWRLCGHSSQGCFYQQMIHTLVGFVRGGCFSLAIILS